MKKLLLSIFTVAALTGTSNAQGISINLYGSTTDISGQTHVHVLQGTATDLHMVDFLVNNETGSDLQLIVTRYHVNNPVGWGEYLCWGANGALGSCYPSDPNPYFESGSVSILADSAGLISTYINPAPNSGTATYRYYISTDGATWLDSVDLEVNLALDIDENHTLSVGVSPNPASDYVNISASGVDNAAITMVDVLGNLVFKQSMVGTTKKLDLAKFKNGIYFVTVESSQAKSVTRKIIVRH